MNEQNPEALIHVGRCTSVLIAESKPKGSLDDDDVRRIIRGTAVFIQKNYLITAGHNLALGNHPRHWPGGEVKFVVSLPGLRQFNLGLAISGHSQTIDCKVVGYKYKGNYSKKWGWEPENDIAILQVGFNHPYFVSLSTITPILNHEVDVIGYPGTIGNEFIIKHPELRSNVTEGREKASKLLPEWQIVVTRGRIIDDKESTVLYQIATCPGLSGGCVLYGKKMIGKNNSSVKLTLQRRSLGTKSNRRFE